MTERVYRIYREPGPGARRRATYAHPKKVGEAVGVAQKDALGDYVFETYLSRPHGQYVEHRFEWRGERSTGAWKQDDGDDKRGRDWQLVVTLANGTHRHEATFVARRT